MINEKNFKKFIYYFKKFKVQLVIKYSEYFFDFFFSNFWSYKVKIFPKKFLPHNSLLRSYRRFYAKTLEFFFRSTNILLKYFFV